MQYRIGIDLPFDEPEDFPCLRLTRSMKILEIRGQR